MTIRRASTNIAILMLTVLAVGCGSGKPEMSTATGTVMLDGKPVPGGRVMLTPVAIKGSMEAAGRPASGLVNSDGTFELMTYSPGDGVVLGKHTVVYYQPEVEEDEEDEVDPFFKNKRLYVPAASQQEISTGSNELKIEVMDKGPKRKR